MIKKLFHIKYNENYAIFKNMLHCLIVFSIINILNICFILLHLLLSQRRYNNSFLPFQILEKINVNFIGYYLIIIFFLSFIIIIYYFVIGILITKKQWSINKFIESIVNSLYNFLFTALIVFILIVINYISFALIYGTPSV